ncbi:MAG: phosphoribosyl-AMP cyclohydrolase [Parvibaculales bacterium]
MPISEEDLSKARLAWGDGLIAISKAYEATGIDAAAAVAGDVLDTLYGYALGPVLFKPTLSGGPQTFRPTKQGALSYFIGHDPNYPQDGGFGIKHWRAFSSETSAVFIEDNVAMWMGWVTLTDKNGDMVKVDKSWGYRKDADGALKIVLHHSSIPYAP